MELWFLMIFSFVLTFLLLLWLINFQKNKKIGQFEREEGLEKHKSKNNTPIFGGVAFILVYFFGLTFLFCTSHIDFLTYFLIIFPMMSFGMLGFLDDLLILKRKNNEGIRPNVKFFIQILISAIFFVFYLLVDYNTKINFILFEVDLGFLYGMFILLAFSGFTNAANLTDGIDGLLGGVFSIILVGYYFVSKNESIREIIAIIFSGICAFLYFNLPKAKIFMGNVGSLAIGSIFTSIAIVLKLEILLIIFGFIFIVEALSVILQVAFFKITKGKRIFKMAPIHHHFEIIFDSEIETLLLFYFATIVAVVMGVLLF
jgi:phospho-N-acetylmuramoyl-pentapeptide-transferase